MFENKVGYIRLRAFNENSSNQLKKEILKIEKNNTKYNKYWFLKVGLNKNNAIQIKENTIHFSFNTKGLPNIPPAIYI